MTFYYYMPFQIFRVFVIFGSSDYFILMTYIKGVKSLWGNCSVFPRLGTRDTDRWRINLPLWSTCQCPWCPIAENAAINPKWFNSLGTNFRWDYALLLCPKRTIVVGIWAKWFEKKSQLWFWFRWNQSVNGWDNALYTYALTLCLECSAPSFAMCIHRWMILYRFDNIQHFFRF